VNRFILPTAGRAGAGTGHGSQTVPGRLRRSETCADARPPPRRQGAEYNARSFNDAFFEVLLFLPQRPNSASTHHTARRESPRSVTRGAPDAERRSSSATWNNDGHARRRRSRLRVHPIRG